MIEIKQLNKKTLQDFIFSKEYKSMQDTPISKHRAISHINNPRTDNEEVLLFLAYFGKKLVGYLGVLPDSIFINNKKEVRRKYMISKSLKNTINTDKYKIQDGNADCIFT